MEKKLEVGMYVRTVNDEYEPSIIGKIFEIGTVGVWIDNGDRYQISKADVLNASLDRIDLVEKGDYANGKKVVNIGMIQDLYMNDHKVIELENESNLITNSEIKSIVTKEQFLEREYVFEESDKDVK